MSYKQVHLSTIYKQARNGLFAHIYEHLIVDEIDKYMRQHGQLFVVDYDTWGKTYGRTCLIESRFQTKEAERKFKSALRHISKMAFTLKSIETPAISCACEYSRPLTKINDGILNEIHALHETQWQPINNFTYDQADIHTSVNTIFEDSTIKYGRYNSRSFKEFTIQYTVSEDITASNPALKALAILIVQTIALNNNGFLTEKIHYYDDGDEWHEGADSVGYRTYLRFPKKNAPDEDLMERMYKDNLSEMLKSNLIEKIIRLVRQNYKDESSQYFSLEVLNNITNGLIIGAKGWYDVTTKANIEKIITNINCKIISG